MDFGLLWSWFGDHVDLLPWSKITCRRKLKELKDAFENDGSMDVASNSENSESEEEAPDLCGDDEDSDMESDSEDEKMENAEQTEFPLGFNQNRPDYDVYSNIYICDYK